MVSLFLAGRICAPQVTIVYALNRESFVCKSESSWCFTANVFPADRRSKSSTCFTASVVLADRNCPSISQRVSTSQLRIVSVFHDEPFSCKSNRLRISRQVFVRKLRSSRCFAGNPFPRTSKSSLYFTSQFISRKSESPRYFTASMFLAGRNRRLLHGDYFPLMSASDSFSQVTIV